MMRVGRTLRPERHARALRSDPQRISAQNQPMASPDTFPPIIVSRVQLHIKSPMMNHNINNNNTTRANRNTKNKSVYLLGGRPRGTRCGGLRRVLLLFGDIGGDHLLQRNIGCLRLNLQSTTPRPMSGMDPKSRKITKTERFRSRTGARQNGHECLLYR